MRLVRDDRDGVPTQSAQRADDRPAELGLDLEARTGVEHDVDHLAHVVDAPAVVGDDVEHLRYDSRRSVVRGDVVAVGVGRVRPRRRREVTQVRAHEVERAFVVVGDVVHEAAGERDRGTAEVFLRDRLAERLLHHRGAGGEDRRVPAHHAEVRQRRDERAMAGRRAEHCGDERHPARAPRLGEHVGGCARAASAPVGPKAGAFEHHDQRHAVDDRELGHAVALGVGRRADRARLHGEVFGRDHDRAAVDAARTHDDGVGGGVLAADERAELLERTRVEQVIDARAGVELARVAVFLQPLVAAHRT